MVRIKKNMDTEESRRFWASFSEFSNRKLSDIKELPYLGDSWWKAETELSIGLLSIRDNDYDEF